MASVCLLSCVWCRCLVAESRSLKAINCSWCSERWTQEDSYPSGPYFMVRVHYVQHSEGIHHSAMEDLSSWSRENISVWMCVSVGVCAGIWMCAAVSIASQAMWLLSTLRVCVQSMALIEVTFSVAVRRMYQSFNLRSLNLRSLLPVQRTPV